MTTREQRSSNKALAPTEPKAIADLAGFTSPGGNVGCYLDPTTVRCDISEGDWAPRPRPADWRIRRRAGNHRVCW